MKRIILKSGEEDRIKRGHPWVYDNEVDRIFVASTDRSRAKGGSPLEPGECADVESSRKEYLGRALANPNSKIIARIYSPSKEGIDKGFFKHRIREALYRRAGFCLGQSLNLGSNQGLDLGPDQESGRLVFAEADFLPGLIIDRFSGWPLIDVEAAVTQRPLTFELVQAALGPPRSWLAVQFLAWGMDCRREMILEAAEEVLAATGDIPTGIIEKSTARVRELEGLPLREGLLKGDFPGGGIVIFENSLPFAVDPLAGQKTGHFLDQRGNRLLAGGYAALSGSETAFNGEAGQREELRVLDAFSYTGGFGIHVLRAVEHATVIAVDASAQALETARKNAALNGAEGQLTTLEADVFETLRGFERKKEKFDMVILDPPAFAKSRTALNEALRGYKEINLRAIKLLRPGGLLVSCSCSHALDEANFKRMVVNAAADAERRLIQIDFRFQGPDHPILIGYDESLYLKCGFYRVL